MPESRAEAILAALRPLINMPMWKAGYAGAVAWFEFGKVIIRPDRRGGQREVGKYALHVTGPWRWCAATGFIRADQDAENLEALGQLSACVQAGDADESGHLILHFDNGDSLEVDVTNPENGSGEGVEFWRLLQPGLPTPHLVASSRGVEWHEA